MVRFSTTGSITGVIETALLSSTLARIGIAVAVGRIVVPLSAVRRTAVMTFDVSPVAAGISPYIGLRLNSSATQKRGGDNKYSK